MPLKAFDDLDNAPLYIRRIADEAKRLEISRVTSFGFDLIEFGIQYKPESQTFIFREKGLQVGVYNDVD